jgi:peptidoglycan hydrolase-like protein with peptidoglycan-binding domain
MDNSPSTALGALDSPNIEVVYHERAFDLTQAKAKRVEWGFAHCALFLACHNVRMRPLSRFAVVALIAFPFFAGAVTVDELRAQVAELLARIAALQQQIGDTDTVTTTTTPSATACPQLGKSLKLGSTGEDVRRLQQFLSNDRNIYPEAQVTGYYGVLTEAAVKRWQAKFNIVSSGTPVSTGYGVVGPRTAAVLALQCAGTTSYTDTTGSTAPSVGGFIQVTPIAGNAPLSVTVQATVNTVNSCSGAAYTLDYGDGTVPSQIVVPAGNCQQMIQTLGHTYPYGGTYPITLSAGAHRTSATVTVYGAPAVSPTPSPTPTPTPTPEPKGSISAFVTSGAAPLNTTFYVSCVGGTAYNIVFGDGQDLGSANVAKTSCGGLQAISHTYASAGTYNARLIIFVQQTDGTITPQEKGGVSITVTGSGGSGGDVLGSMTITPGVGGNPLAVSAQFEYTVCGGYALGWGDGPVENLAAQSPCSSTKSTVALNHTYGSNGNYTITLTRGAQVDTASITISN